MLECRETLENRHQGRGPSIKTIKWRKQQARLNLHSKLCKVGIMIGQRNPASSNEWNWVLTITESFAGKNSPASSNKCCKQETLERPGRAFINLGTSRYWLADVNNTNINIYLVFIMPNTTLLTPINNSLVSLKVLIKSKRTWWFTDWTLCNALVQGTVRVGYSSLLLLLRTLGYS